MLTKESTPSTLNMFFLYLNNHIYGNNSYNKKIFSVNFFNKQHIPVYHLQIVSIMSAINSKCVIYIQLPCQLQTIHVCQLHIVNMSAITSKYVSYKRSVCHLPPANMSSTSSYLSYKQLCQLQRVSMSATTS
jgi:hypothetical protein